MGFYELMKTLSIGNGDEVIVISGNCAVMINAILDRGAKPVYSDVDLDKKTILSILILITHLTNIIHVVNFSSFILYV